MLHDHPLAPGPAPVAVRLARLNAAIRSVPEPDIAQAALAAALDPTIAGNVALVSSFGADSIVLLHMVSRINPDLPILFIDTELLFAQTLHYQKQVAALLGLRNIRIVRATREELFTHDPEGLLRHFDPDACCALRKVAPLAQALAGFDGWITGRKRYQAGTRADMPVFETDDKGRVKINPLAHWQPGQAAAYIDTHSLPRHPLVDKGYRSIGCAPCTTPVRAGEDERAGRWRGRGKVECGLHRGAGNDTSDDRGQAA